MLRKEKIKAGPKLLMLEKGSRKKKMYPSIYVPQLSRFHCSLCHETTRLCLVNLKFCITVFNGCCGELPGCVQI